MNGPDPELSTTMKAISDNEIGRDFLVKHCKSRYGEVVLKKTGPFGDKLNLWNLAQAPRQ